jgi:hypothetical protein
MLEQKPIGIESAFTFAVAAAWIFKSLYDRHNWSIVSRFSPFSVHVYRCKQWIFILRRCTYIFHLLSRTTKYTAATTTVSQSVAKCIEHALLRIV